MRVTGWDFLIESWGQIYLWNMFGDNLHKMMQPTTLGELLDMMNDERDEGRYKLRVWQNPRTKWERVEEKERLPEHDI